MRPIKSSKEVTQERLRSAISNGSKTFRAVDHRSASARRFKDILRDLTDACGGRQELTPQQQILLWKASCLTMWTELLETGWMKLDAETPPTDFKLKTYVGCVNALVRILKELGIPRRVKIHPPMMTQKEAEEYLRKRGINFDLSEEIPDAAE